LLHLTAIMSRKDFTALTDSICGKYELLMHAFDEQMNTTLNQKSSSLPFRALSNLLSHLEAHSTSIPLDMLRGSRKRIQDILLSDQQ
jgi:hypothetical protein